MIITSKKGAELMDRFECRKRIIRRQIERAETIEAASFFLDLALGELYGRGLVYPSPRAG